MIWGWSHAPFLGGLIEGNTIEDSERGGLIGVEHHSAIKTNAGRVYMAVTLRDNCVRWSDAFLARRRQAGTSGPPPGITIGYLPTLDPGELVVQERGQPRRSPRGRGPPRPCGPGAQINGQRTPDQPRSPDLADPPDPARGD